VSLTNGMPWIDSIIFDESLLGWPYKELVRRVKSAKSSDFVIYTCKDDAEAFMVTSSSKKRSLLMRAVLPAARDKLHHRVIVSDLLRHDFSRIPPEMGWFQSALETLNEDGIALVSFFLPAVVGLRPPEVIVGGDKGGHGVQSGILTTDATVICIVNSCISKTSKFLSRDVIYYTGGVYRLPFICSFCGLIAKECLKKCQTCKQVYYCSKDCQRQDWSSHKDQCQTPPFVFVDANDPEKTSEMKAEAAALVEEFMRKVQLEEEEEEKQRGAAERVW